MYRKIVKIVAVLLLIFTVSVPHITFASDTGGFRFLFPPSDKFEYVERKLTDAHYIVCVGEGDDDGAFNICDCSGQLLSDINFQDVAMIQGSKLYVSLKSNNLAIIDLITHAAKKFDYSTYGNLDTVYDGKTFPVLKNDKMGMADPDGNIIIAPDVYATMNTADHLDGFLVAKDYGSYLYTYGVINRSGKEIVPAIYKQFAITADGEAMFEDDNGGWGVLSTVTGDIIVPAAKRDFTLNNDDYGVDMASAWAFIDGKLYRRIERGGKVGLIDNRLHVAVPTEYDKLIVCGNGAVIVEKNGAFGAFMLDGKIVLPFAYDDIETIAYGVTYGLNVIMQKYVRSDFLAAKTDGLYGLYDINGTELLPFAYTSIYGIGAPLAIYLTDAEGKKGLASMTDGHLLTPKFFDNIDFSYNDATWTGADGEYFSLSNSSNMFLAQDGRQYAVYGTDGSLIDKIAGSYDSIGYFNPQTKRAFVTVDSKSGLVDFDGHTIIPIEYTDLDGNALVNLPPVLGMNVSLGKKDGKWGVIDSDGHILVPFTLEGRTVENWSKDMMVTSDVQPYLHYNVKTGLLTGISYDNDNTENEFVIHGSCAPEYWGSYLGKGAVLILA